MSDANQILCIRSGTHIVLLDISASLEGQMAMVTATIKDTPTREQIGTSTVRLDADDLDRLARQIKAIADFIR